jgi:hypothetical protein
VGELISIWESSNSVGTLSVNVELAAGGVSVALTTNLFVEQEVNKAKTKSHRR